MPMTPEQIALFLTPFESADPAWSNLQQSIQAMGKSFMKNRQLEEGQRHNKAIEALQAQDYAARVAKAKADQEKAQQQAVEQKEKGFAEALNRSVGYLSSETSKEIGKQFIASAGGQVALVPQEVPKPVPLASAPLIRRVQASGEVVPEMSEKDKIIAESRETIARVSGMPQLSTGKPPEAVGWELTPEAASYGITREAIEREVGKLPPENQQAALDRLAAGGYTDDDIKRLFGGKLPPPPAPKLPNERYRVVSPTGRQFEFVPKDIVTSRLAQARKVLETSRANADMEHRKYYTQAIAALPDAFAINDYDAQKAVKSQLEEVNFRVTQDWMNRRVMLKVDQASQVRTLQGERMARAEAFKVARDLWEDKDNGYDAIFGPVKGKVNFYSNAISMLTDDNPKNDMEAVYMIARLYDSGRLSNQDIEMLAGQWSWWGNFLNWCQQQGVKAFSTEAQAKARSELLVGGGMSSEVRNLMVKSLNAGLVRTVEDGKAVYQRMMNYRDFADYDSAKEVFQNHLQLMYEEMTSPRYGITGLQEPGELQRSELPLIGVSERRSRYRMSRPNPASVEGVSGNPPNLGTQPNVPPIPETETETVDDFLNFTKVKK
jgi:hypothetical protein